MLQQTFGQLVGSRGVVNLPDGFQYRDQDTVRASMKATNFARHFQPIIDILAEQNKLVELQRNRFKQEMVPVFFTFGDRSYSYRNENTLFFSDSRYIQTGADKTGQEGRAAEIGPPWHRNGNLSGLSFSPQTVLVSTSRQVTLPVSLTRQVTIPVSSTRQVKLPVSSRRHVTLPQYFTRFSWHENNLFGT